MAIERKISACFTRLGRRRSYRITDNSKKSLKKKLIQFCDNIEEDASHKVSYQEISAWGQSFERLMESKEGQNLLADFLKSEYSDENILFWQACEELKREKRLDKVESKARTIYEDFISLLSPKEVSLDSRIRDTVNVNMLNPTTNTFDVAQSHIYALMQSDSYPRFTSSKHYKSLVQQYEISL